MKVKLTLGDWSEDGHSQFRKIYFESNKTIKQIRAAYINSVRLTEIYFHAIDDSDYASLKGRYTDTELAKREIAVDYEIDYVSQLSYDIFTKHGIDVEKYVKKVEVYVYEFNEDFAYKIQGESSFVNLFIDFLKLSLPDLSLERVDNDVPNINGWHEKDFNFQFGYGLYK